MSVKIRLTRTGRKLDPSYRVVVTDSRSPRDGRFIEQVGFFDPNMEKDGVRLNEERILYWLSQGAKPSDTIRSLLSKQGIWKKFTDTKVSKKPAAKKEKKAVAKKSAAKKETKKVAPKKADGE